MSLAVTTAALALTLSHASDVSLQGSIAERAQVTAPSEEALLSTADQAILFSLSEVTAQVKGGLLDDKLRFWTDTSLFVPIQAGYADVDVDSGQLESVAEHDTGVRPFITLAEYWLSFSPFDHLVMTIGKQRTQWGSGLAFSPADVLNPPRDPTDPSLVRAGFLHARVDAPFEFFTVTAMFAPAVLETNHAIPSRILFDEGVADDDTDDEARWAAALRAYVLLFDTDVNAWILASHRYNDAFENHLRFALSISRNIFSEHEVHTELLVEQGSSRLYANPACVDSLQALALCQLTGPAPLDEALLDSERIIPKILVGWRWMPESGESLSVEYLYQADGYLRQEHQDFMRLLTLIGKAQRSGVELPTGSTTGAEAARLEAPLRLAFTPTRRHTLFLSWTKPQVMDDFTLNATLIVPVEDLSSLASGSVAWQAQEWLVLSMYGFVPLPSPAYLSADTEDDPWQALFEAVPYEWQGFVPRGAPGFDDIPRGDFDVAPFRARLMFEARAYF